jgi:hypothetical protein
MKQKWKDLFFPVGWEKELLDADLMNDMDSLNRALGKLNPRIPDQRERGLKLAAAFEKKWGPIGSIVRRKK